METLSAGSTISRYRLISPIGEGGMGAVYLAEDKSLDRKVAIKMLNKDLEGNRSNIDRFIREAKAASGLNHPNILVVYEIGETDSGHFIVSEYIEGQTLRTVVNNKDWSTSEILDVSVQIATALVAAHSKNIVHRDIKPENIIIRPDGLVKVLDFGLAKLVEAKNRALLGSEDETARQNETAKGIILGTVNYMSPEQAKGEPVDTRTDIFSLGVLIYEMIAGRTPFGGDSLPDTFDNLKNKEPHPLLRYASNVPDDLQRIVSKTLRKNKDDRYQTMKGLLADLKELKESLSFEEKLKRSKPPSENETAILHAATGNANRQTAETQHSFSKRINNRKSLTKFALAALLIAAIGVGYWFFAGRSAIAMPIDSIAVMPFENMTHDQNTEYLSDGVTESLINSLSQLPHISVIARNSVFSYKNQTPNLQQVAMQLNVRAVLTGRVLMQGDTLDVRVELTDTQNNIQLWGDHYVRKAADIFAVQDEIARQVTDALRVRLTGGQQEQVTKRYTENAEAYRLYLQGRYYMNQVSEENLNRSIPFFDQAIALDPRYALAYAARGESFFVMGDISLPMSEAKRKVEQDIAAALSIDDKLVEARMLRANIEFQYDWNFAKAEEDFKQVIALNPNYAEAHRQYGAFYLPMMGRPMEGVEEMKLAQQLDPVNPGINVDVCLPYYFARQYDQSIAQNRKTIEMFPNFFLPHMAFGQALFQKGDYSTGIEEIEKAKAMEPSPPAIGQLGYAYAKTGRRDEARKLLAELKELSKRRHVASYWMAMIYVGLDEKDEAFAWLEKAYQERSWWLLWIKMDPMVDSLRSDPRFTDLMRRVGFPQ